MAYNYRYIKLLKGWRNEEVLAARLTDEQMAQFDKERGDADGIMYKGDFYKSAGLSNSWALFKKQEAIHIDELIPTDYPHAWLGMRDDYRREQIKKKDA